MREPGAYALELSNSSYAPGTQTVALTLKPASGFADVAAGAWYFGAVRYAAEAGIFGGTGTGCSVPRRP